MISSGIEKNEHSVGYINLLTQIYCVTCLKCLTVKIKLMKMNLS